MKEYNFKYLCVSYLKDYNDDKFYFRIFKHKSSPFFSRYSKVIEITLFYRRLILEF